MRVLVCGSREYENFGHINQVLDSLLKKPTAIIHGDAPGVDTYAGLWARNNDIPEEAFPADWDRYGKAAGPIRNKQMLDEAKPTYVLAFLSKDSKGTKNMIQQAEKEKIPVMIIDIK